MVLLTGMIHSTRLVQFDAVIHSGIVIRFAGVIHSTSMLQIIDADSFFVSVTSLAQ